MDEGNNQQSFLKINSSSKQVDAVNNEAINRLFNKKISLHTVDYYVKGILDNDRTILSQAITLVESTLETHYDIAQQIIEKCLPYSGNSFRTGITGIPGVGKSTFVEALGKHITAKGYKLAVLAIDPSSQLTKGSILGDKTRMELLSNDPNAFIRPSPAAGSLGGVTRKTREIIILCEAAGYNVVFVETVGVGQSETIVHSMVDYFLLLLIAGAGDELQGIKRGIMEMADAILINKADGDNLSRALITKTDISSVINLFPHNVPGWMPAVDLCSAKDNTGIDKVWLKMEEFIEITKSNGYFKANRLKQMKDSMYDFINNTLKTKFYNNKDVNKLIPEIEKALHSGRITSYTAANRLLDVYFKTNKA